VDGRPQGSKLCERHPYFSKANSSATATAPYEGVALSLPPVTALERLYSSYRPVGTQLALLIIKEKPKMTTINNRSKFGGALLAFSLLVGIGMMPSMTAQAQGRHNGEWKRRDRNRNENQDQNQDWRRNRNRNQDRDENRARHDDRDNRDGNNGRYNDGTYNNGRYNNGTYNNGRYNNGTYNNGRYNNGGYNNSSQMALNQGYQAGLNTGASDAQRGQNYSPQRSHYYKDASSQQFRNGFVRGYDAGFRQYGGSNNNGDYRRGNGSGVGSVLGGILGRP